MDLFFAPMACSLASRISLYEAGLDANFRRVQLATKTLEDGSDFRAVSTKGQVPALRADDGRVLTEGPAVLQFIADQKPESQLAPPPGSFERYELQGWLTYIGTEIHKQVFWTIFSPDTPAEAKAFARSLIPAKLAYLEGQWAGRPFLTGDRFTVADAYLVWALMLMQRLGADFADYPATGQYLARCMGRVSVQTAVADESALLAA
jgi:glutathione S-transferase